MIPLRQVLVALLVTATLTAPAFAKDSLSGRWKLDGEKAYFTLTQAEDGAYTGSVRAPNDLELYRLRLTRVSDKLWTLTRSRRVADTLGMANRLVGEQASGEHWNSGDAVTLTPKSLRYDRENRIKTTKLRSEDKAWELTLPAKLETPSIPDLAEEEPAQVATIADVESSDVAPVSSSDVASVSSSDLPVVRVLITGFDRFPRPKNHPRWISDRSGNPEPRINPAGWAVREFSLDDLCPEFRGRVRVELFKCLDVPVDYVTGAKVITDTIGRVDADVTISFGVGADSGADADVETTCENLMDDCDDSVVNDERGPFQLPDSWPPAVPEGASEWSRSHWTDEDKLWPMRYPDNSGVSYNGHPIDPDAPDELTSLLPVDRIVKRVKKESLRSVDGGWGPGRYICNNVMFKVIQTQAARGRLGGFIHLNSWSESRRAKYLKVLACAIEESASEFVETRADAGLPADLVVVRDVNAER